MVYGQPTVHAGFDEPPALPREKVVYLMKVPATKLKFERGRGGEAPDIVPSALTFAPLNWVERGRDREAPDIPSATAAPAVWIASLNEAGAVKARICGPGGW